MAHSSCSGVLIAAGLGEGALLLGTSAQSCLRAKGQVGVAEMLLNLEHPEENPGGMAYYTGSITGASLFY